ncbi:nascent polypeptide-associated complex subunit alpha, muscle-specific form-like [Schistocerca gregaria]|uniref:nascent polypeptide-associated complex subunit alpha, muscle-specific form-like n=1 Tax=Schistocerca gregaria TaxID=7010 RepID=UPI00211E1357|nr:nascent polypeptide-associated complex subunit alpha, muscle-specific form-like [Schistocerca gregaria]
MGDGEPRRDAHWQSMVPPGGRKALPEPQVIVRKFLFPNLANGAGKAGAAGAPALAPAPSSTTSGAAPATGAASATTSAPTAAVATVPPLVASGYRVVPRRTPTPPKGPAAAGAGSASSFPPIAPKDEFGCRYFFLNAGGSTVGLVPYRSVIKRGADGADKSAAESHTAKLLVRPGPAASAPPPTLRPALPPPAPPQRVSVQPAGGNLRLQMHPSPAPQPATVLVRPLNGVAVARAAAPQQQQQQPPPRPAAPGDAPSGAKTVIVQGSPDGKSIVLKNPVILQPYGSLQAGGSKTVVLKGLPKAVGSAPGRMVVLQSKDGAAASAAASSATGTTATVTTTPASAAGRSSGADTGTLHLEVVVQPQRSAGAQPAAAPSVVVAAPLHLPRGVRVLRVPARDVLVADVACQTEPPALSVPDTMLRLSLRELGAADPLPQPLPASDYPALWDSDNIVIRPVSSSPPQTHRTPSPSARMPAAGDVVGSPVAAAAAKFGKHRLPADPSTGDAGPPAKRPRAARDLALRLFAFRDWACCLEPDDQGNVPLHCAVLAGDINRIKRQCCVLRARDFSLDICNNEGETPLHLAVIHKMTEAVDILIKFGAKPQFRDKAANTSFHLAVQRDAHCPDILWRLLTAPGLRKTDLELFNDDGYAPMHLCAMYDKVEELRALISSGAGVNLKDTKSGRTPLFHAVETNSATCCRVLLHSGANSTEQNYAGHTPIIAASEFANPNVEAAMINHKEVHEDIIAQLERGRHRNSVMEN